MSTRSYICKENEDGTYLGVYCHFDGYIAHNGVILSQVYNSRDKVQELISYGDLSSLGEKLHPDKDKEHSFDLDKRQKGVCVFYGRERGEQDTEAKIVKLEEIDNPRSWIDYCYVFGLDNKWRYFRCGSLKEGFLDLDDAVKRELEETEEVSLSK